MAVETLASTPDNARRGAAGLRRASEGSGRRAGPSPANATAGRSWAQSCRFKVSKPVSGGAPHHLRVARP